jgi:heme/copper-type cytochrome/quinol oxidase subunit 1
MLDNTYYMPGFFNYFLFSLLFIEFLAVLIFAINYFQKRNNEYFFLALSTMFIIAGREITFYMVSIEYFLIGMILMIGGTILFSNKLHEFYKWY